MIDQLDTLHGGAERSLWNLTRHLPPFRYRASIVTFKSPKDDSVVGSFPCPVHVYPLERTYGRQAIEVAFRLRHLVQSEAFSLTQTFFETSDLWAGPIIKLSGCPVLISSRRDMGFRQMAKHRLGYRILAPIFDGVHAVSDAVRTFALRQHSIDPAKVVTIPNGVDIEAAMMKTHATDALRKRLGLEDGSRVIVDVTTIRRVKGLDILARTAAIVCSAYPTAVFLVVGEVADEQYMAELSELVNELGLRRNFRFVGGMDNPFPILHLSEVFCHLSRTDGLSNALLEAMASALPCVVSRAGGNGEVVEEGLSGFVVPLEKPELAANRIMTLLQYPDCARRLGEHGQLAAVMNFSAEAMAGKFADFYDCILAGSHGRHAKQ